MIDIKCYPIGMLQTNCYLITDVNTGDMAVIDCGQRCDELLSEIKGRQKGSLKYILLTHGHFDHISGVKWLKNEIESEVCIGVKDSDFTVNPEFSLMNISLGDCAFKADRLVKEGDVLTLGETEIRVIETPGHTVGGVCYIIDNNIFCGDTLFRESVGRTDLPTGSFKMLMSSLKKLSEIQTDMRLLPGHGEESTLYCEKKNNPYMMTDSTEV